LSDLESGKGNPTLEVLSRVSAVLGLEIRLAPRGVGGGGARSAVAGFNRPTG
jgi:hypothetical protein